jgi:cell wall-associated NlpC family hydrolase
MKKSIVLIVALMMAYMAIANVSYASNNESNIPVYTEDVDISGNVKKETKYAFNSYDKVYVNEKGILALSKGDIVKVDGEINDNYYTITENGNIFFIPKSRLSIIDQNNVSINETDVKENLLRQKQINGLIGFSYLQLGKPYIWGGSGHSAYDCSSLMQESYKYIGFSIPRTSRSQSVYGTFIEPSNLKIGDLLFFKGASGTVSLVGMYLGEGRFIHASSTGKMVVISNIIDSYYSSRIVAARRIIN